MTKKELMNEICTLSSVRDWGYLVQHAYTRRDLSDSIRWSVEQGLHLFPISIYMSDEEDTPWICWIHYNMSYGYDLTVPNNRHEEELLLWSWSKAVDSMKA